MLAGSMLATHRIAQVDVLSRPEEVSLEHTLDEVEPDTKGLVVDPSDRSAKLGMEVVDDELETGFGRADTVDAANGSALTCKTRRQTYQSHASC